MRKVNVGVIGFGTIGTGVVRALKERRSLIAKRSGIDLVLKKICDKDLSRRRGFSVKNALLTRDYQDITNDESIDIIVELVGGIHPAKEIIIEALKKGKHVVTANKALLAEYGQELFKLAFRLKKNIYFEASVGGGIPIIQSLREGLISNRFEAIYGIVNGTSNFILTQMCEKSVSFKEALVEAQKRGFAEKKPTLDIEGFDSAHKLVVLTQLAFGKFVRLEDVFVEGISRISLDDIKYATEMGLVIKLLAIVKNEKDELELRVHPTLIPEGHLLASVDGAFNAIYVASDMVGDLLLYGPGAGQNPTASSVVSDIVSLAEKLDIDGNSQQFNFVQSPHIRRLRKIDQISTRFYIRFMAIDKPGVLAKIAGILGKYGISIASVSQKERRRARIVPVVIITHEARERSMRLALERINKLAIVRESVAIRMEET
ncbi:MAG: homoserine dehydrogenase [Candidatus Omnitrophica bacterium CG11_big_fil_rev_8_21_14_0_20_42_13]|uniref:Homoserine dehydrogenase n=1 Tax=Candidatus Ghiorseimicrobium undicola TaxID=1974746 RepID=A0A2H0LZE6_9BACT|nr:MAG: homoserine dehydrogenase [Candidatus Omnitrophica bacterium CG11_big_fil_rev_8_21_14_0_20_42_13]